MNAVSTVERAWLELANRPDLVDKEVVFDNRVGDYKDRGKISRILVEGGYVTIESLEIQAAHAASRAWSPNVKFKIDEERYPHVMVQ